MHETVQNGPDLAGVEMPRRKKNAVSMTIKTADQNPNRLAYFEATIGPAGPRYLFFSDCCIGINLNSVFARSSHFLWLEKMIPCAGIRGQSMKNTRVQLRQSLPCLQGENSLVGLPLAA